jgi:5-methylcytosine-specific restriction protein A
MASCFDRTQKGGRVDPASLPRGPGGRALCRACGREVGGRRMTFCSDVCVHNHRLLTDSKYVRDFVYHRDRGVCAQCGIDTKEIAAVVRELNAHVLKQMSVSDIEKRYHNHMVWPKVKEMAATMEVRPGVVLSLPKRRKVWVKKWGGNLWDADHVVPVFRGGGSCGLNNMQTLCIPCHKSKTYKDLHENHEVSVLCDADLDSEIVCEI